MREYKHSLLRRELYRYGGYEKNGGPSGSIFVLYYVNIRDFLLLSSAMNMSLCYDTSHASVKSANSRGSLRSCMTNGDGVAAHKTYRPDAMLDK